MSKAINRWIGIGALVLTALLASACVYDPYTGGYYPCCGYYPYGYPYAPYYSYPPPIYPYPQGPPPMSGSPQQYQPPPGTQGEAPYASPRTGG